MQTLARGRVDASDMRFHRPLLPTPVYTLGRISNDDGDDNDNGRNAVVLDWQYKYKCELLL